MYYTALGTKIRSNAVSIRSYDHRYRELNYTICKAVYPAIDKATSTYQCSLRFCNYYPETIMLHLLYLVVSGMLPRGEICSCYTVNYD